MILPSLFSNEAPVYPCFVTPSKMLGLNGKKKKKKRHLHEKTMIPSVPFSPVRSTRSRREVVAWQRRKYRRRRSSSSLLPPPSRRGSSSLLPAPPGASPPLSATLRRPLVPALPARVARASSGELPSTRARASSGELLSRRLPPASSSPGGFLRRPPQAPSVASAEAEAYTEPELVLLEALLGVQARDS